MADVQTPILDIEEEVEVPQEEEPVVTVSTAAAEVSGKEAVEASKSVDEALDKLVGSAEEADKVNEVKQPVEEKKPEEKKQPEEKKKDEKKKSKKSAKGDDDDEGDIAGGIEQLSALFGIDKAELEDYETWPFCDRKYYCRKGG